MASPQSLQIEMVGNKISRIMHIEMAICFRILLNTTHTVEFFIYHVLCFDFVSN